VEGEKREASTAPLICWNGVEQRRGMCMPDSLMSKPERKKIERGEDLARVQGRKQEEGWGPGSGCRVEGRRAWGWGGGPVGRRGWVAVSTAGQRAWGQGLKGGGSVGVAAVGPAKRAQCRFAINQGFSGQMKLQTIKSWSYVAPKFQIK
jgi:hypothetical protein